MPDLDLIESVTSRLMELLGPEGFVTEDSIIDACLAYDERVPVDGIYETFDAIESFRYHFTDCKHLVQSVVSSGAPAVCCECCVSSGAPNLEGLTYDEVFMWTVLMFGDCGNAEFRAGKPLQASLILFHILPTLSCSDCV